MQTVVMNKFIVLADDIYHDYMEHVRTWGSGVIVINFEVTIIKFLHLFAHILVFYLSEDRTHG